MSKSIDPEGLVYQTKDNGVAYELQKDLFGCNTNNFGSREISYAFDCSGRFRFFTDEPQNKKFELLKKFQVVMSR